MFGPLFASPAPTVSSSALSYDAFVAALRIAGYEPDASEARAKTYQQIYELFGPPPIDTGFVARGVLIRAGDIAPDSATGRWSPVRAETIGRRCIGELPIMRGTIPALPTL